MSVRKNKSNDTDKELWMFVSKDFHNFLKNKVKEMNKDIQIARKTNNRETARMLVSEQMIFKDFLAFSHVLKNHELKALVNETIKQ